MLGSPQRVRQQGQQATRPQRRGEQVDQQAVGAQVVGTAGRRMPRQTQRNQGHQRAREQDRGPRPAQHGDAADRHHRGKKRRPPPRPGDVHQARDRPDRRRTEVVTQRLAGHVGNGQRHQQRGAHRPRTRGERPGAQRAVSGGVEHTGLLRRHEERREQERADRHDGRDLAGGPHERQAHRGHRPGVGQSGGGQRVRQRQRRQSGGRTACQQGDAEQQRPHRGAACGRGGDHRSSVLPVARKPRGRTGARRPPAR